MKTSEKQELKKKLKRLGLFMLIMVVPSLFLAVILMYYANLSPAVNVVVLVVVMLVLYCFYLALCTKIDKKKAERMKNKKDPFSE